MKKTPLVIAAAALAGVLAFTGCTPEKPAPTPSATETTSQPTSKAPEKASEPKSAEEAIDGARSAYKAFLEARSDAFADPSKVDELKEVAIGQALDRSTQAVTQIMDKGLRFSGGFEFEFQKGAAGKLTNKGGGSIQYGSVELTVCMDTTSMIVKNADGSPGKVSEIKRWIMSPQVVFDQNSERWMVYSFQDPKQFVKC